MPRGTTTRGLVPGNFEIQTSQAQILKTFSDQTNVTYANSGTAATQSIDSASPLGAPRLKVSVPAGNTWTEVQLHTGVSIAKFVEQFCARVYLSDYTKVDKIQIYAGNSGYVRYALFNWLVRSSGENNFNGVHPIYLGQDNTSAGGFLYGSDTLQNVKIRVLSQGAGPFDFWVDTFAVPVRSRAKVVFTFDDASATWMTKVHPYLATAGIKATFGINSGDVGGGANFITTADITTLRTYGHDIMPHNVTNTNATAAGAAAYLAEFDTCCAYLRGCGVTNPFIYHPWVQGVHFPAVVDGLRGRGVKIARGVANRNNGVGGGLGDKSMALDVSYMDATITTIAQWKAQLDTVIKYGKTMISMGHVIKDAGAGVTEWLTADFQAAVDYAVRLQRLGLVDIVPISEWYQARAGSVPT